MPNGHPSPPTAFLPEGNNASRQLQAPSSSDGQHFVLDLDPFSDPRS
jgi:hypothetical protein